MLLLVCVMLLVASDLRLCLGLSLDGEWEQWKKNYGKKYKNDVDEEWRRAVWEKNWHMIEVHNQEAEQGKHSYKLGMNHRGDAGEPDKETLKVLHEKTTEDKRRNEILEEMSDIIAEYDQWARLNIIKEMVEKMSESGSMTRKQILEEIDDKLALYNIVTRKLILKEMDDTLENYNKTTRKHILEEMSEKMALYDRTSRQLILETMAVTMKSGRMSQNEILEDMNEAMTEEKAMSRKLIVEEMAETLAKYDRMARKQERILPSYYQDRSTYSHESAQEFFGQCTKDSNNCTSSEKNISDSLPRSVDHRERGLVTPVKDQGDCGSCWAFSAAGALEGQLAKKTGQLLELSTQNLIDCVLEKGCDGGYMGLAFKYVIKNGGMNSEKDYPYAGKKQKCRYKPSAAAAQCKSFKMIPEGDERALAKALNDVGPLSVTININVSDIKLDFYKSGVYYNPECVTNRQVHAMLLVGYGETAKGEKYWIVKNSWGEDWGEDGYMWIARNRDNHCGIASAAMYPLM